MQPTYFPWAGYFNLISKVDYFIFLDDAQFQKGTWHNRNKLLVNTVATWLTIPVIREFLGQKICDSIIDDQKSWRKKHTTLIQQNYHNHPYFSIISPIVEIIQDKSIVCLSDLNQRIIKTISKLLNIQPVFLLSSELNIFGERSERLARICEKLHCEEYISPPGASLYLKEDGFVNLTKVKLTMNEFAANEYQQHKSKEFVSHLSILDVLANLGLEKTKEYISA